MEDERSEKWLLLTKVEPFEVQEMNTGDRRRKEQYTSDRQSGQLILSKRRILSALDSTAHMFSLDSLVLSFCFLQLVFFPRPRTRAYSSRFDVDPPGDEDA